MPMNQPLRANSDRVAGAAHTLIWKYLDDSSLTSSEQSTARNATLRKTPCRTMMRNAAARAIERALRSILPASRKSPEATERP